MRVVIFTSGRFHLLDLARELDNLGMDVIFRSCVPTSRAIRFGLPARCCKPILAGIPLQYALTRTRGERTKRLAHWACRRLLDRVGAMSLPAVDVFIGISGMSGPTALKMRARGTRQIWIERGSRHILSQKAILEECGVSGNTGVSDMDVAREIHDYTLANVIVLPSIHAMESFSEQGCERDKLFVNPYGADLKMFPTLKIKPKSSIPTFIMAGTWSRQKGCDLLEHALSRQPKDFNLLHAGSLGDLKFPKDKRFKSLGHVDQSRLSSIYAEAHVGILPSRQDGFGMVLVQMCASGLNVIGSDRTGAPDLAKQTGATGQIRVFKANDIDALAHVLNSYLTGNSYQKRHTPDISQLTWSSYGRRYLTEIISRMA